MIEMCLPVMLNLPMADLIYAFKTSNLFSGKIIVTILFVASIWAWSVMTTKSKELKSAQKSSRRFVAAFRSAQHPLALFLKGQKYKGSPLYKVYESACVAMGVELEAAGESSEFYFKDMSSKIKNLSLTQIGAVRNAAERAVADQALELENKMGILATAVSASPMLGLLGTVWGVLDAFAAMGVEGSANISSVAPGISSALLTTVVGLLVALPSAIGYNMLTNRIRQLCVQMDNFTDEFVAALQRTFVRD